LPPRRCFRDLCENAGRDPILLLAGHHLYSWPESVLTVEFLIKNARVEAVISSRPISPIPCRLSRVKRCLQHVVLISIACIY